MGLLWTARYTQNWNWVYSGLWIIWRTGTRSVGVEYTEDCYWDSSELHSIRDYCGVLSIWRTGVVSVVDCGVYEDWYCVCSDCRAIKEQVKISK